MFHDHSVELAKHYVVTETVFNLDGGDLYPSENSVVSLDVNGGGSALAKIQNFRRRISRFRQLRERLRPAVVISHLEGADYINLLSGGPGKIILCVHGSKLHDTNIRGPVGWLRKNVLIPMLYNRADRIVTVSRDIISELVDGFGVKREKVLTINNFFEVAQIEAKSQEPLTAAEAAVYGTAPVLVTSGRLTLQKNQSPLLSCFAALLRRRPAKLIFLGDGELREVLTTHARALGLRVYAAWEAPAELTPDLDVYFLGMQQNPFKYLRSAAVFVFPSAWEGFPMALGEAMICGLPVLSTDCPTGPREMLAPATANPVTPLRRAERGDYGILLPIPTQPATLVANLAIWTDAIDSLLADTNEQKYLGNLARKRMQDFTRERIFGQWVKLVEEVQLG